MTIQVISIQDVVPPVFTVPEGITLECGKIFEMTYS